MRPAPSAAGKKEVQAPAATRTMVGSHGHITTTLFGFSFQLPKFWWVFVRSGGGGMRVGPQYQAVVPDFDPGKN